MKKLGLIGYPLSHSFSRPYFTQKFEKEGLPYVYNNYPLEHISDFPKLIKEEEHLLGLNVTIPHKESVIPYLDELDEDAAAIGAVNVIKIRADKSLKGYNTDFLGFKNSMNTFLMQTGTKASYALILGTGGAAKAVAYALEKEGIVYDYVSRNKKQGQLVYDDLDEPLIDHADLIINTTPLGMHPNVESFPKIPYNCLGKHHRLYDLVYNPSETSFLRKGKEQGASIINGLPMLHAQAEAAWQIWTKLQ